MVEKMFSDVIGDVGVGVTPQKVHNEKNERTG